MMFNRIKTFLIIGLILGCLDIFYLSQILEFFKKTMKNIQKSEFNIRYIPALICYFFLILSIQYFIIYKNGSLADSFILGMCIYSVFELTNYATIKKWPIVLVIMDSLWGGLLFLITTFIYLKFFNI